MNSGKTGSWERLADALRLSARAELSGLWGAFRDPLYYGMALLGGFAWLLPEPRMRYAPLVLLGKALVEEFLFRVGLQETLSRLFRGRMLVGPLSAANFAASALFAALHLTSQSPLWALSIFFPGLLFGWTWDRHGSLAANGLLHFWFNACLFYGRALLAF